MTSLGNAGDRTGCRAAGMRCLGVLALLVCVGATGCRHKVQAYTIPLGAQVPVLLEDSPPIDEGTIATLPLPDLGPLPETTPTVPVPRKRPATPREETQPTTAAPADAAPAELAIGNLSTGSDATPQIQQEAQAMISSILRQIAALSSRTADAQRRDLNKVRNFVKQAQQALNTGDMDGAKNLAVKAGVLMDELQKR
jgi:hypothetical protein